ncbi:STAS domain-containing protein [Streptomyces sp. NPDC097619]|uniref:STAS domain-containing protein n=1 Tax=Streptomyces sp. NPDC097619 TaxID=3157228 RepID=UPI003326EA4B
MTSTATITSIDGDTAVITPRGDIDHDSLPGLESAAGLLPTSVTRVVWDFHRVHFMAVAALHLLDRQRSACQEARTTLVVTGLLAQPRHLLLMAAQAIPDGSWNEFLPTGNPGTSTFTPCA